VKKQQRLTAPTASHEYPEHQKLHRTPVALPHSKLVASRKNWPGAFVAFTFTTVLQFVAVKVRKSDHCDRSVEVRRRYALGNELRCRQRVKSEI
jgi:hypothetical protein